MIDVIFGNNSDTIAGKENKGYFCPTILFKYISNITLAKSTQTL